MVVRVVVKAVVGVNVGAKRKKALKRDEQRAVQEKKKKLMKRNYATAPIHLSLHALATSALTKVVIAAALAPAPAQSPLAPHPC